MISILKKAAACKGIIEYNEEKVSQGKAELILSTLPVDNIGMKVKLMEMNASLNPRLRKNRFIHQIVSFSKKDNVGEEKLLDIVRAFHKEMGWEDHQLLIYKHQDTAIEHYHIVTPTVDVAGSKANDFNDFKINRDTCRKLEVAYDLEKIVYEGKEPVALSQRNALKYTLFNYIKKHQPDVIPAEVRNLIISNNLSNTTILDHLSGLLSEKELKDFITKSKQTQPIKKLALIDRLSEIRKSSSTMQDFEINIKKEGLYMRKVRSQSAEGYNLVYGDPSSTIYITDSKCPKPLQMRYLYKESPKKEFSLEDQKKFLKTILQRCSYKSSSLEQFEKQLLEYNIGIQYHSDKRGTYGYSVKSNNVPNADWIGASSISDKLGLQQLMKNLAYDPIKIKAKIAQQKIIHTGKQIGHMLNVDQEIAEEEYKRQQEERGKGG